MKHLGLIFFAVFFIAVSCGGSGGDGPCSGVDCSGHGECDDSSGYAVCNCDDGYVSTGQLECVEASDPCTDADCEDWEKCVNGECIPEDGRCGDDYDCEEPYRCDEDTNFCEGPCHGIDCGGFGDCVETGYGSGYSGDSDYDIYCDCYEGYVEEREDGIPVCVEADSGSEDPCHGISCGENGKCEVIDEEAVCNCEKGYVAEDLECVIDPCAGVVCEDWEKCVEGECELIEGRCYSDEDCSGTDICDIITYECGENVCESVNCENGGVCSKEDGAAVCNCPHGFKADETVCVADDNSPAWIGIQWPYTINLEIGEEGEVVYAQIYMDDGSTGAGKPENKSFIAQLGIKKDVTKAEYPVISSTWHWTDASFNTDFAGGEFGNNHEYMAGFPMDRNGDFAYIYRFSLNGGESWWYCDKGIQGDDPGPDFITSPTNYPGLAKIEGTVCGEEICRSWEWCAVDECKPLEGRCSTDADCKTGQECDSSNTCVDAEKIFSLENFQRTYTSYSFDVVFTGSDEIDISESKVTLNGEEVMGIIEYDEVEKRFSISEKLVESGKYSYLFKLRNKEGKLIRPFFVPFWIGEGEDFADFGWRDAFVYQLMIDRFKDGDSTNNIGSLPGVTVETEQWMGGDFRGIIQKIKDGYFTDMGVNALWISSPILNPHIASMGGVDPGDERYFTSYHAYHPVASGYSYFNDYGYNADNGYPEGPVETAFGTKEELHELVKEAHKRGIRIIPDFVANHVHSDGNIFDMHPEWFYDYVPCHNNWDSHRIDCWFTEYMPDFNFADNPEARKAMTDHALWMIQEFNFDGFRADALKHMDDIFVKELRSAVVSEVETTVENHELPGESEIFYMVGESLGGWARYHTRADMVQGQVNEDFYSNAKYYLLWSEGNMHDFAEWTEGNDTAYLKEEPTMGGAGGFPGAVMGNFFGNHDQDRALSESGGDYNSLRLVQTYLMTAPINVPMLYQGDEIGVTGRAENGLDGGRRKMMKFEALTPEEADSLEHMKKLGIFRKNHPALRYGTRLTCGADSDGWIFTLTHESGTVIVGINRGSSEFTDSCPGVSGTFTDIHGTQHNISETISIPPDSSVVMGK
ncbi:MAG: alpha-amylase family glycosyl hydrolase [bacterium]